MDRSVHASPRQMSSEFGEPRTPEGVFRGILDMAQRHLEGLRSGTGHARAAAVGHLRGTGPGVSFSGAVRCLETAYPIELVTPFEGSDRIGGAAWVGSDLLDGQDPRGIAKLRWGPRADDLPMHAHPTDRFIVVLEGRGFFHVCGQPIDAFDGTEVRTIAARRMDVFAFTSSVVHTFSTAADPMTLLSCHLPFLPLDDPEQYELPRFRWTAGSHLELHTPSIEVSGWSLIAS